MSPTEPREYGWESGDPTPAHSYIGDAVVRHLAKLNVQRVLDLGCGNGALANRLGKEGYDVVGIDADQAGIDFANANGAAQFERFSVYDDPKDLAHDQFDLVLSSEVVEHLYAPRALPVFARSKLKDGGHLLLTTPYHGYAKNLALSLSGAWDKHLDPFWDGGHIKFWSRRTLQTLVEDAGFSPIEFEGLGRTRFLWKSMLLIARKESNTGSSR